jgi:hypothetical protein
MFLKLKAVPNTTEPHATANRLALRVLKIKPCRASPGLTRPRYATMFLKLKAKPCHTIPDRAIRYLTLP